jgi:hypothetical protein
MEILRGFVILVSRGPDSDRRVLPRRGNNTVAEAFNFGLPVIVTPLFWDQYDNAQRVHESGFGHRLASYTFEDEDFLGAPVPAA